MGFSKEDKKQVAKGTILNILGGVALASSKAFQFVLRRLFGGPAFGLYAITYGVMELCANFILGGYGDAITYHASKYVHPPESETPQAKQEREQRLYSALASALRTPILISLIVSGVIIALAPILHHSIWHNHNSEIVDLLRLVMLALPLLTTVHLMAEATRAHLDMRLPVIVVQTMFPGLTIGIALLLFFGFGLGIQAMALGLVISLLLCLPVVIYGYQRYYSLKKTLIAILRFDGDREVQKFAIPQCLNMASNLGLVKLDSLMLSAYISADAVGIYVLITELTQLIRLPKMAFSGIFGPLVAKYQNQGNKAGISESLMSLAQITSFLGILVLIPVQLFYPEFILGKGVAWTFSLALIWLLSVGPLMSAHFGLAGNLLLMTGHSRLLLANSLGSLALNLLLNLLLIPRFGLLGAAIATAVSNFTVSSLQIFEMGKLEGIHFRLSLYHRIWIALAVMAPLFLAFHQADLWIRGATLLGSILLLIACSLWIPGPTPHPLRRILKKPS